MLDNQAAGVTIKEISGFPCEQMITLWTYSQSQCNRLCTWNPGPPWCPWYLWRRRWSDLGRLATGYSSTPSLASHMLSTCFHRQMIL